MTKKILFLVLFLVAFFPATYGQAPLSFEAENATATEVSVTVSGEVDEFEYVVEGLLHNNTEQDLNITWVRVENNIPENWNSLICDSETCWPPNISTNTILVRRGDKMNLDVHFQPNGIAGSGSVLLCFYAQEDSSNINLCTTFEGDFFAVGINDPVEQAEFNIYPNPTYNRLNIDFAAKSSVDYFEIYNVIGKKVTNYSVVEGYQTYEVDVSELSEGMYFISLYNKKQELIVSKVFSKID